MANTLTSIAPVLYSAAQEVSNEPFGVVSAINTSFDNKGVAYGDSVTVPVAPMSDLENFTPANVSSTGANSVASAVDVAITAMKKVSWHLTGEEQISLENGGTNQEWIRQKVAQGMRALRNSAETAAAAAIKVGASKAYGTAGTTPFATSLSELVNMRKILRDQGAPMADLQLVVDSAAYTNLLQLGIIQQAYAAGSDEERRQGRIMRQFGFQIGESAGIDLHSQSTPGTAYATNATAVAGALTVALKTGVGAIPAGSIVSIADDSSASKYVVNTAIATNANPLLISRPGFGAAIGDSKALTFTGNYTPNLAFERMAVVGVMRPPLIPENPTISQMIISDSFGMSYLMLDISQYGQRTWELHLAYGFKVVQPEHVAILIG